MDDLLGSVRERYGRRTNYWNLSTLAHRARPAAKAPEPDGRRRWLPDAVRGFFRPQLAGLQKQLRGEIDAMLAKRDKLVLQAVNQDAALQAQRAAAEIERAGRARQERAARDAKRVELFMADTAAKLAGIRREADERKARETRQAWQAEQTPREDRPLTYRAARRVAAESAEREAAALRREIGVRERAARQGILRKLRDDDAYEERRRGTCRQSRR